MFHVGLMVGLHDKAICCWKGTKDKMIYIIIIQYMNLLQPKAVHALYQRKIVFSLPSYSDTFHHDLPHNICLVTICSLDLAQIVHNFDLVRMPCLMNENLIHGHTSEAYSQWCILFQDNILRLGPSNQKFIIIALVIFLLKISLFRFE